MRTRVIVATAVLLAAPLSAQEDVALRAGIGFSSLGGGLGVDSRTGPVIGVDVGFPLGAGLTLRPGVSYANRGFDRTRGAGQLLRTGPFRSDTCRPRCFWPDPGSSAAAGYPLAYRRDRGLRSRWHAIPAVLSTPTSARVRIRPSRPRIMDSWADWGFPTGSWKAPGSASMRYTTWASRTYSSILPPPSVRKS